MEVVQFLPQLLRGEEQAAELVTTPVYHAISWMTPSVSRLLLADSSVWGGPRPLLLPLLPPLLPRLDALLIHHHHRVHAILRHTDRRQTRQTE